MIWGGIVNDSRDWCRSVLNYIKLPGSEQSKEVHRLMVRRQIAFVYALKTNLRTEKEQLFPSVSSKRRSGIPGKF